MLLYSIFYFKMYRYVSLFFLSFSLSTCMYVCLFFLLVCVLILLLFARLFKILASRRRYFPFFDSSYEFLQHEDCSQRFLFFFVGHVGRVFFRIFISKNSTFDVLVERMTRGARRVSVEFLSIWRDRNIYVLAKLFENSRSSRVFNSR